jgi:ABC-type nitrate/sulfonate/bicarbonate transport system substrate-binding protein
MTTIPHGRRGGSTRRLFSATAAAALGAWATPRPAVRKIRAGINDNPSMATFYCALESGYFAEEALDIEVEEIRGGPPTSMPALSGGALDLAFAGFAPAVINAVDQGAKVRIVAGREMLTEGCGDFGSIYGRPESFPHGLDDLRELKGKRVAVSFSTSLAAFALDVLLEKRGLSLKDLDLSYLGAPEALAALRGKHIDALVSQVLYGPTVAEQVPGVLRNPGMITVLPGFQFSYIYYGAGLLQSSDDAGTRFLRAYLRGCRDFVNGKTPKFLEDYAKSNGLDTAKIRRGCRSSAAADGHIQQESLQFYIDWAVKRGYCPRPMHASQLIDTRFLRSL